MPRQVTIQSSGHAFTVNDGETVLAAALRAGIVIAYGCRHGSCGTCKGRLVAGAVDYGTYQEQAMTEAERSAGMALFCQAKPLTDLTIQCREIGTAVKGIQIKLMPARVMKLTRVAPDVMALDLKLPANDKLVFLAGQYVDLVLRDGTRRSFSMANAPHDDAVLQLHLRNYGGPFSQHVFGAMKERDILRVEGPFGTFFLREESTKPMILLASGTGFAPIKAIVEHVLHAGITRPMTLYWGCRVGADLYMNALAESWQRDAKLRYVPVLSDATAADHWTGRTGFVHRAVMEDFPDLSGHQVYACGAPVMVDSARQDFTARCGLPDEEFFSDSFTPAAPGS
ncbi:MAG: CDP-6-deoxy-delta-3,4-glucoseen reductase [Betaproteobacteria bacterium RIFCSPLOWO2_02_FULL_67_26]|nr:MAG: CDP-6-deoxy-delta-3,4-glucoseen reductase [Betaproteobacteria bacterium RIFCSPLOWO2_02_FULL_67_26]